MGSHPLIKYWRLTDRNFLGPLPALPTRLHLFQRIAYPGKVILNVKQWRGCVFRHVFLLKTQDAGVAVLLVFCSFLFYKH